MSSPSNPQRQNDHTSELAEAVRAGDTSRFSALYDRLLPVLYAWASLRLPRDRMSVEDFLQEVWFRACKNLKTEAARQHRFRAWIFVIAKNVLLEQFRKTARVVKSSGTLDSKSFPVADSTMSSATRLVRDESMARLLDFSSRLDRQDRELLLHCGLEGRSCAEIARQIGLSTDAAYKRWQRLRDRMREFHWLTVD